MSLTAYFAIFDGNNLASTVTGLDILGIDSYLQPKRSLSVASVSRSDSSKVTSGFYTERYINIKFRITSPSNIVLESRLDSLNAILQGLEKELLVPHAGGTRKYTATLDDVVPEDSGGAHFMGTLVFRCSDSFGYDYEYTPILDMTGITSPTRSDQFEFEGSAEFQAPHIEIYYTSITGGDSATVIVGSSATGQQITVSRTFTTGDRLVIDCVDKTVTVNGVNVSFSGAFPTFRVGTSNLTYVDDFTTRSFDYFAYYYKRWV